MTRRGFVRTLLAFRAILIAPSAAPLSASAAGASEEEELLDALEASVLNSEKLQRHIKFLFSHGALYQKINGNLLYHGCIPMNEDKSLLTFQLGGSERSGKDFLDFLSILFFGAQMCTRSKTPT